MAHRRYPMIRIPGNFLFFNPAARRTQEPVKVLKAFTNEWVLISNYNFDESTYTPYQGPVFDIKQERIQLNFIQSNSNVSSLFP